RLHAAMWYVPDLAISAIAPHNPCAVLGGLASLRGNETTISAPPAGGDLISAFTTRRPELNQVSLLLRDQFVPPLHFLAPSFICGLEHIQDEAADCFGIPVLKEDRSYEVFSADDLKCLSWWTPSSHLDNPEQAHLVSPRNDPEGPP